MPGGVFLGRGASALSSSGSNSAYDVAVLADSPSGYWKMQEIAGTTATDSSGNARNGTYNSATVGSTGWYSTYAVDFTGSSASYLDLSDLTAWENGAGGSGVFSVECLFYLDVTGANQTILSKGDSGVYEWALWVTTTGVLRFSVYNASASSEDQANTAAGAITAGRWYHIVGYYDKAGNTFGTIINGVAAASNTLTQTITAGTAKFQVAVRDDNFGPLDGRISNVAYYPTKLTTVKASAHYAALPTIPTPASYDAAVLADGPSGYWPMQELVGSTATDSSGNSRNGTYNSTTLGSTGPFAHAPGLYTAEFTGSTSSYVDLADLTAWEHGATATGTFSLECFFRLDNLSTNQMILSKGDSGVYEYGLWVLTSGALKFHVLNQAGGVEDAATTGSSVIAANTWYHVVAYYDRAGTVMGTIINGVSAATASASSLFMTGGTAKFQVAVRDDNFGPLDGRVCNVAYYPRTLNVAEAAVHFAAAI